MKRLLFILTFFVAISANAQFQNNNIPIFRPEQFGAKADGVRHYGGSMGSSSSTLTCSDCSFTAADVSKTIRVWRAGASQKDAFGTISGFTNSTTVTVSFTSGTAVSTDTLVYGTDNTVPFQNCLNAMNASNNNFNNQVTMQLDIGTYMVGGALQTSIQSANPNCQIYLPIASLLDSSFNHRKHFVIRGATAPNFLMISFVDSLPVLNGTVIYSTINGSGNAPAIFGTKSNDVSNFNLNFNYWTFQDLTIITAQDIFNGGTSLGGINGWYTASTKVISCAVVVDGSINRSVQPVNEEAGIMFSRNDGESSSVANQVLIINHKYGLVSSDCGSSTDLQIEVCQHALTLVASAENTNWLYLKFLWNNDYVFIPNSGILGYVPSGIHYFHIENLHFENYVASGHWYDYNYVINDAGNLGHGIVTYTQVQAGTQTYFGFTTNNGALTVYCHRIGTGGTTGQIAFWNNGWAGSTNLGWSNTNNTMSLGFSPSGAAYELQIKTNNSDGGTNIPGINAINANLSAGNGSTTFNFAPFTSEADSNGIISQFSSVHGTGGGIFGTDGGWVGTRTNHQFAIITNSAFALTASAAGVINIPNLTASQLVGTDGSKNLVSAASSGQTTLISGTKALSITGVTTSSKAFVQLVTPTGATLTVERQAVCTSGTVTITALLSSDLINTSDGSVVNYFVIF